MALYSEPQEQLRGGGNTTGFASIGSYERDMHVSAVHDRDVGIMMRMFAQLYIECSSAVQAGYGGSGGGGRTADANESGSETKQKEPRGARCGPTVGP